AFEGPVVALLHVASGLVHRPGIKRGENRRGGRHLDRRWLGRKLLLCAGRLLLSLLLLSLLLLRLGLLLRVRVGVLFRRRLGLFGGARPWRSRRAARYRPRSSAAAWWRTGADCPPGRSRAGPPSGRAQTRTVRRGRAAAAARRRPRNPAAGRSSARLSHCPR